MSTITLVIDPKATLVETLWLAFQQNYHNDCANAAIHGATVRYSPLTFRLAEHLWEMAESYRVNEDLRSVVLDLYSYDEDKGR